LYIFDVITIKMSVTLHNQQENTPTDPSPQNGVLHHPKILTSFHPLLHIQTEFHGIFIDGWWPDIEKKN
jgi:hypothetical protein